MDVPKDSIDGSRWMVIMTVLAVYICFIDRVAISIAIIPMAEQWNWSPTIQGAVMSAFFLGYVTIQIPAGYFSDRYGGKWVLGLGVLLWSLFTLLTPGAASLGIAALLGCRFLMGVAEAVTWPSIFSLYSRWIHPNRRASAVGWMNSGIAGGSVIALVLTPWLINIWSWESAFYVYGAIGLLWFIKWARSGRSYPTEPVKWGLLVEAKNVELGLDQTQIYPKLSITLMIKSLPIWAIVVAHMCLNWSLYLVLSWFPTYVYGVLGADLRIAGLLAIVPTVVAMIMAPLAGRVFDSLVASGRNRLKIRRSFQFMAFAGIAAGMTVLASHNSIVLALIIVTISNALTALSVGGFGTNHLDIAPNQSGLLMGVTNTLASLSAGASIFISGWLMDVTGDWAAVFYTAAGVAVFGAVFYMTFSSVKREFD